MPKGSVILSVQAQNDEPQIWALVPVDEEETQARRIFILNTGEPIDVITECVFLGTFQLRNGAYVGHVFEMIT
jgi:hypothetical protein